MARCEYIRSAGAFRRHAEIGSLAYDALVGTQREIWINDDYSGLIRESQGPVSFFNQKGQLNWVAAGSPELEHATSDMRFSPGCLGVTRRRRDLLSRSQDTTQAALARRVTGLRDLPALIGEAVDSEAFYRAVYDHARDLPDVTETQHADDELGRPGCGLIECHGSEKVEFIFACDDRQLLGYRHTLLHPQDFAPAGTVTGWACYLDRSLFAGLPERLAVP